MFGVFPFIVARGRDAASLQTRASSGHVLRIAVNMSCAGVETWGDNDANGYRLPLKDLLLTLALVGYKT